MVDEYLSKREDLQCLNYEDPENLKLAIKDTVSMLSIADDRYNCLLNAPSNRDKTKYEDVVKCVKKAFDITDQEPSSDIKANDTPTGSFGEPPTTADTSKFDVMSKVVQPVPKIDLTTLTSRSNPLPNK